jgi:sigma-B regulation protein RsbU (phosphoserine phosphatase)
MSTSSIKILFIGDHPECLRLLREQQFEVTSAGRLADGLAQMKPCHADLVLLALTLPDSQGVETFTRVHEAAPHLPIVSLAAPEAESLAASTMQLGAQDYLLLPELTGPMLAKAIRNAIARHLIRKEDQRARHLLKLLMENIPDSIYFKDTASRFMVINKALAKRFGLADPHLAAGKSDADFFASPHAQQALADEQHILQTNQPLVGTEEKETWPDGRVTWVSTTKMLLRDRAGKVFGTFGISRDITEHRRIEQTLAERTAELSKERLLLRTLIDNLPDCVYAKDAAGRKTLANPADLRNLRCKTEAEAIGKSDFDFFSKDVAEKFWTDDQKVLAGYPVIDREEYFVTEKGEKRWLLTSKLPLRNRSGKTIGLVGVGRDITRRKRAEEALVRERLLLRTLIDNLPDMIFVKDAESRFTLTNTACTQQLGASQPEEVLGKSDADWVSPELAAQYRADEQALMRSGQPVTKEESTQHKTLGMRWSLTTKVPLKDESGHVTGLIGIARDITEHKLAEDKLAHEQELFQTLLDNLPDSIYYKNRESRFVRVNRAKVERLLKTALHRYRAAHPSDGQEELPAYLAGVDQFAEYVMGKTDFDFYAEVRARSSYEDEQEIIRTGQPSIGKLERATQPDGSVMWIITTKMPWRDKDGNIIGTFGVSRDITPLKLAEDKLAYEQELFQTLLDNLPDSIYYKNRESRFVRVNRAKVERLLKTALHRHRAALPADGQEELPPHLASVERFAEFMAGKTDFDFYAEDRARLAYEDEQEIIRTGQPSIGKQERATQPDGSAMWIITTKMPWHDKDGNIIGTFGVSRDITPLKLAEEKLAEHTLELERKNRQNEEELKMARELQLAMLPHEFPCVPRHKPREESHLEFFSFFSPMGAVSGDFFDIIPLSDTRVGLFICDVMGHDVRAALVTAMMRALVADLSVTTAEPGELLTQINREVAGVFMQTGSTMYATAFYLIADVARAEFCYANAAHPEPLLVRRQRGTVELLGAELKQKKGPALGLFSEGRFPTHRLPMETGDLIAMFTDGLIETEGRDNETFSSERLLAMVRRHAQLPANELLAALISEVKQFSACSGFEDDVCIAGVEVKRLVTDRP